MYPDKVIYYLFDFDYVNSTLEPRPKLKQEELNPLQMGIMWIVLTFMAWCLVFLWISLPFLLCKMIVTFLSLDLKTILLLRAPSHTGGHCLPNWSQGHITLFLFVENHSAWLWEEEVCIFIYLTTEHCFVFMREQWGVPQTRACILNEALASMLARLRVACSDSHQWWLCPWVVLSHADWGLTWVTGVTLCQWCVTSALSSGVAPSGGSQPPWCADPGSSVTQSAWQGWGLPSTAAPPCGEPLWEWIFQAQPSLQRTAAPTDLLTATSWETLSQKCQLTWLTQLVRDDKCLLFSAMMFWNACYSAIDDQDTGRFYLWSQFPHL